AASPWVPAPMSSTQAPSAPPVKKMMPARLSCSVKTSTAAAQSSPTVKQPTLPAISKSTLATRPSLPTKAKPGQRTTAPAAAAKSKSSATVSAYSTNPKLTPQAPTAVAISTSAAASKAKKPNSATPPALWWEKTL